MRLPHGACERRGGGRGRRDLRGHRELRRGSWRVRRGNRGGTARQDLQGEPREKMLHRQGEWQEAGVGHPHHKGQGGAMRGAVGHRADIRRGFPRMLVRLPSQSGRKGRGGEGGGGNQVGEAARVRRGSFLLFRHDTARKARRVPADACRGQQRDRPRAAMAEGLRARTERRAGQTQGRRKAA